MMEIPLEKEAVFMDPTQTLELAQALKLSPTLLQSMNILQMTTLELSAYLKDLAWLNRVLARKADRGVELVCGLPNVLKEAP